MDDLETLNEIFHGADKLDGTYYGKSLVGVGLVNNEVCAIISSTNEKDAPIFRVTEKELYEVMLDRLDELKNPPLPYPDDITQRVLESIELGERARKAVQGFKEAVGRPIDTPLVNLKNLPKLEDTDCGPKLTLIQ
tara:strand:+ start:856 stop:1263 length:408 start_codon:yes stop_codon:yes gene_type:complete